MNSLYFWIVLGILVAVLIAVGISYYINLQKQKRELAEKNIREILSSAIKRADKVKNLEIEGKAEYFEVSEILIEALDVGYISTELSDNEFSYLEKILKLLLDKYNNDYLNKQEYLSLYKELAIQIDMIAPYYKIASSNSPVVKYNEGGKEEYRERARALVDDGLVFSEDWEELKNKFIETFYDVYLK